MKFALKPLEWGVLANEFALTSSYSMLVGGMVGLCEMFQRWQIALFSVFGGILVFAVEYPRGYRSDLRVVERKFQDYLEPFVSVLGIFGRNYYARFLIYLILGTPCCFLLPTLIGGVCIIIASTIYLKAAFCGYQWQPIPSLLKSLEINPTFKICIPPSRTSTCVKETVC